MKALILRVPGVPFKWYPVPRISNVERYTVSMSNYYTYGFYDLATGVALNREDFIPVDKLCKLAKLVYNVED